MTTDRNIFDFRPQRGIMAKIEYPGVAELVPRHIWDVEIARSNRVTRTNAPRSIAPGGVFLVYCGAELMRSHKSRFLNVMTSYLNYDTLI